LGKLNKRVVVLPKGITDEILLGSIIQPRVFPILGIYNVNDFMFKS
tara:strand:+ start:498 stop:635 length:138 start_codon:yes stop_codon:yes gene_type:complete